MLILPQRTQNNAFNVFIWASLFVGLGMQMCLYSIEWYARQNCPQSVVSYLSFSIRRSFSESKKFLERRSGLFYSTFIFLSRINRSSFDFDHNSTAKFDS